MALDFEQITAIAGAVGAVAGAATAFAERSARHRFRAHVDDDLAVVLFWEAWLRLQEAAGGPAVLDQARQRMTAALAGLANFPPRHEGRSFLASALLLYRPARARAWLARAPFYVAALLAAAIPLSLIYDTAVADHQADAETASTIALALILSAVLAGMAVLLRMLAQRLEETR